MKPETVWRTKLIREFKQAHPEGFIWAMDAKFKAGFPDLLVVLNGVTTFFELKVVQKFKTRTLLIPDQILNLCQPVQVSVLKSLGRAGAYAGVLVLETKSQNVAWLNPYTNWGVLLVPTYFKQFWQNPQFFTGILK